MSPTRPASTAIRATALTVRFGPVVALDHLDFALPRATSTALVGPNGSGKTTLLDVIAGLRRPTSGTIDRNGCSPTAYVLQHLERPHWMPLTVDEVIRMGRYGERGMLGRLTPSDRTIVAEAAARLEVDHLGRREFGDLSGGQRQRVLVAQALAAQARLLLLDEPITGLDLASQERILDILDEETASGTTIVISTHHLDEARHCDQVLLLDSRLVAAGSPDEVLTTPNLRAAYGERLLGDHDDHDHDTRLLVIDEHAHGTHDHTGPEHMAP